MPPASKTRTAKSAAGAQRPPSRFPRRSAAPASPGRSPRRGSSSSSSTGLVSRVQSGLPSRKRNTKRSGVQRVTAAIGAAASKSGSKAAPMVGMAGILAGGVGVAAAVARRRTAEEPTSVPVVETMPAAVPVDLVEAPASELIEPPHGADSAGPGPSA